MSSRDYLEDILILAFFFLLVYAITYLIVHHAEFASLVAQLLSKPAARALASVILFPIGIVFMAVGVRSIVSGVKGKGRIATGFIMVVIGVVMFLFSIYTIASLIYTAFKNFMEGLASVGST